MLAAEAEEAAVVAVVIDATWATGAIRNQSRGTAWTSLGRPCFLFVTADVRFWLLADIQPHPELCPLYPRKRTFARQSKKVRL